MRVTILVWILIACDSTEPRSALDYVALCAPGQRFSECDEALQSARGAKKPALPTNDLVKIEVEGSLLISRDDPYPSKSGAFKYVMTFRDGYGTVRARVLELIVAQLGELTRIKGTAPIADPECPGGDYWVASDGIWILSDTKVTWYSKPIVGLARASNFPSADKYRQAAPSSAALWRKIGHVLVTY